MTNSKLDRLLEWTRHPLRKLQQEKDRNKNLEQENKQLREDLDLCHKVLDLKIQKLEKIKELIERIPFDMVSKHCVDWLLELKEILEEKQ